MSDAKCADCGSILSESELVEEFCGECKFNPKNDDDEFQDEDFDEELWSND